MSLTRKELEEIWDRLKKIERINHKVWKAKHYKWANAINWEVQRIKDKLQDILGQME
jgi:hypothetical protein